MRPITLLCLSAVAFLTGCAGLAQALSDASQMQTGRNYATNPVTLPPAPTTQPTWNNNQGEEYQTILVNTPTGMVYKRCKVLNGNAVACF